MPADWTCASCDFSNIATLTRCDLCDSARPVVTSPPRSASTVLSCPRSASGARTPLQELPQQPPPRIVAATSTGEKKGGSAEPLPPAEPSCTAAVSTPSAAGVAAETAAAFAGEGFTWSDEAAHVNRLVFGEGGLRPLQLQAVNAAMSKRDVLVVMPTGAGKSRCFHLPALLSPGLTVVVAPLLSLILDQVDALSRCAVRALHLASTQTMEEAAEVYAELRRTPPTARLLYVTPERLQQSMHLRDALARLHTAGLLERLVVDEAHCIISWGKDFRPDYLSLGSWRAELPGVPITLLSATLPPAMRAELLETLDLNPSELVVVQSGLDRPNLHYEVWPKLAPSVAADQVAEMLGDAADGEGCAIVYCHSQSETERVCDALLDKGLRAAFYHSMVEPEVKRRHHDD